MNGASVGKVRGFVNGWCETSDGQTPATRPQIKRARSLKSHRLRLRVYRTASKLLDRLSEVSVIRRIFGFLLQRRRAASE